MAIQYTSEFDLSYTTKDSCGLDLFVAEECVLTDKNYIKVRSYTKFNMPKGYFGLLAGRSSSAVKRGIEVAIGIVDQDYTGEVSVVAKSISGEVKLLRGERIAQYVIVPYCQLPIEKISSDEFEKNVSDKERGDKGFGSSGL
jgi:deoxyuridine 5'-triphosphate nucleotidohydrolase